MPAQIPLSDLGPLLVNEDPDTRPPPVGPVVELRVTGYRSADGNVHLELIWPDDPDAETVAGMIEGLGEYAISALMGALE